MFICTHWESPATSTCNHTTSTNLKPCIKKTTQLILFCHQPYVRFFETKISGTKTKVVTRTRACVYLLFFDDRHQVVLNSFQPKEQKNRLSSNRTKQDKTRQDVFQKKNERDQKQTKKQHRFNANRSDADDDWSIASHFHHLWSLNPNWLPPSPPNVIKAA